MYGFTNYDVSVPYFYERRPLMDLSLQIAVTAFFIVLACKVAEMLFD